MSSRSPKLSPLEAVRQELDAAQLNKQKVAARRLVALHESAAAWSTWGRDSELADADVARLTELVSRLEAEADSAAAKAKLDDYRRRFKAQVEENAAVADLIRTELPKAWDAIASVLEAIARAEINTQQIVAQMPDDFGDDGEWIGNPEAVTRWQPPVPEKVLSSKVVELWCDPNSGRPFVDQTREPTITANKREFLEVAFQPFTPAATVPKLYNALVMPRLDAIGPPIMFNGPEMRGAGDVLAALQRIRDRVPREPVILVRHEPVDAATPASRTDVPPFLEE